MRGLNEYRGRTVQEIVRNWTVAAPTLAIRKQNTLVNGKQLAAVLRIKALWRLHCCALGICGFGERRREAVALAELQKDAAGSLPVRWLLDVKHH
jgi:hypothetical protein